MLAHALVTLRVCCHNRTVRSFLMLVSYQLMCILHVQPQMFLWLFSFDLKVHWRIFANVLCWKSHLLLSFSCWTLISVGFSTEILDISGNIYVGLKHLKKKKRHKITRKENKLFFFFKVMLMLNPKVSATFKVHLQQTKCLWAENTCMQ